MTAATVLYDQVLETDVGQKVVRLNAASGNTYVSGYTNVRHVFASTETDAVTSKDFFLTLTASSGTITVKHSLGADAVVNLHIFGD